MKSFFQRFHDSQPATSKSSRTKDAAYKQWISSSKPEKQRPQPSSGAEHPTEYHTTHTAGPRSPDETNADLHGHVATGYSTRYSTFPGSSTNRNLPPNPSRSRTYPLDPSTNEQRDFPQTNAKEKSRPSAGRNEPPELSSHDGNIAFRVKTERPSQSHPLSPPLATQQHQVWLPEVQVEPKEKRRQKERQRHVNEDEDVAFGPQQKPDSPYSEHGGTRRYYGNEREVEANKHRRSDQKEKELDPKEHHRDHASGVMKESQQWEQQVKDMHQLRERENRKKERLKLRREREDAEDKEKVRAKERLEQDRARVKQGASEKGEAKEKTRRGEWDRGREDDKILREERHQRRELQKEKEARERQIQLEQRDMNEKRDREREVKDERERERRERKARERQAERERFAREQTENEYREKLERERQERQRQRERDQQEKRDREQAELERRDLEFLQRDRITQKQLQPRKDQDLRQREPKPKETDMLRADRERQERRKKDRQLWEQQREREREGRERRWRGDLVRQIPEPNLGETGVDRVSIRSKKRVREGVSDSEREQWHAHASDRLAPRTSAQVNELAETEDGRLAPNADPPRRFDAIDEPKPQPFPKSAPRSDEYTLKSQPRPPGRSLSVLETSAVAAPSSKQTIQPPASSNTADYNPLGFLIGHNDTPPIERPGSTAPIKPASHPVSYSVVRVPGPETSKQIPEVEAPQVARRRTASSSQDRSAPQPSRPTPSAQAQVPYPGPIPSRSGLFTNATLEGPPQDIKILPPEITSVPQTGILSAPHGSPNSFQEAGSAGRGVKAASPIITAAATHLKAPGNQDPPTRDNVIAQSFQKAQLMPSLDHVTPVPPIPNHPSTTSTDFLAVPNIHPPVKYSGLKGDIIPQNKENSEYGNPRQKDSVSQAIPLLPVLTTPASKPAATKRQSDPVPGQHEVPIFPWPPSKEKNEADNAGQPHRDPMPPEDSFRITHISREALGHARNKMQDETRLNNTFLQPPTIMPTDEFPPQASTTLVEPQYSGDKLADNKHQRLVQELVPPTVARYVAHDKGHHAENHLTPSLSNDSRGVVHSRHQRHASENDVNRRGGKPFRFPSEGLSAFHSQQVQEPKPRANSSFANPGNKEGNEKIAFRLPVDIPAIGTGSPDRKPQNQVSEPQLMMGPVLQDQQQQGHHVTVPSSVPPAESMTSAALIGSTIVRPGTAVPRSSITQPPDDTLPHLRAVVPPISYSQSQSVSRPPIDRPGTAIGIRQSVSTTSQSLTRGNQPVISKLGSNKAESMPFPDKPVSSVRPAPTETISQETPNENSRSRTNSETVLVPNLSHSNGANRMKADAPAQQAPYPVKEVSSKDASQTIMTELNNKPMLSMTSPATEIIRPIGVLYPERTIHAYEDRPATRLNTVGKTGGHGTIQQQSGLLTTESVARKDDSGALSVVHPVQSRQRQQSSPRLQSEGNLSKVPGLKGSSIEDPRLASNKISQTQSTRRVEPVREDQSLLPTPGYPIETDVSLSIQYPPADDRGRGKYSTDGYSPNAPQRTPLMLGDPAPTLPYQTGHSKAEEGRPSRSQRNIVHGKDVRLAELPSPPKASDVPGQLYLHDARRNLASRLEQQQLSGSPNSASGNFLGNVESDTRLRTSSNRDEYSPRHVGIDSSPSTSSKASQSPDLRTRDYAYARTSPNTSQHNPSPRSKPVVVESESQPGSQNRDETSQHTTRAPALRQSLRERQDHIPEVEDKYSRTPYQTSTYATNDTAMRPSGTNQKTHIVQNRIPYQMQDPRAEKTTPQRDGQHGDARDAAQPISTTHSRSRSDSQIALDNTASYSRYLNNAPPYAAPRNQPYVLSSSGHVRPSAPTTETLPRPPDQSSYYHSHQLDQPQVMREEAVAPQQAIQPPTMKSIPSKRDAIEPSPQEAHYQNPSSGPQPPTPQSYDIWLPPASSREVRTSHRSTVTRTSHKDSGKERERARRSTTTPRTHQLSVSEPHPSTVDPRLAKAYHYLKSRKVHTMSLVSVEAQDGAASTVIGSPTTSILSQIPINIPPEQDPIMAAREWTEAGAITPGQRIHKPGLVWADPEDPPLNYQQVHRPRSSLRRRTRSSGSRSREASDSDQPLPA